MQHPGFNPLPSPDSADDSGGALAESGRELEELLSPISREEFVNHYFARTSLHVPGTPGRFDAIFNWERFQQAIAAGQKIPDRRYNITASFTGGEASGSSRRMIEAYHHQIVELLQAGATICVTNIHMADPLLARWARAIRSQLNFAGTVGVNCYISADGSGLPMHYDKRVATTLQLSGKKRWRFSTEAAKPWPDNNALYQQGQVEPPGIDAGRLPDEMEFREVELSPGDILCIPAGAWHSARAEGDSFAINLYFAPRNFLELLTPLVQEFAASNADWRAGPPATADDVNGPTPATITAYLRDRLDEFQQFVRDAIDGPDKLREPWLGSLTHSPHTGWRPVPKAPPRQLTAQQRFRLVKPSFQFVEAGDRVVVPCDFGVLKLPAAASPILRRLKASAGTFSANDFLSWRTKPDEPTQNEVFGCLHALIENRIVEISG